MITRRDFLKITAASGTVLSLGNLEAASHVLEGVFPKMDYAMMGTRQIPVIAQVDVLVVGGSTRGVAAAVAAARNGSKVMLVTDLPYMGEDVCGAFLYELKDSKNNQSVLIEQLFSSTHYTTPLHVKKTLEDALIDENVDFLYSSFVTHTIGDDKSVCGVVIANRSGRQAILAKIVVDATHEATIARKGGVQFEGKTEESTTYTFTVVGSKVSATNPQITTELLSKPFVFADKQYPVTRCTISHKTATTYAELMGIEQELRSMVWTPEQVDSSDSLWYIPSQRIASDDNKAKSCRSVRDVSLGQLKPKGMNNIYVLGPCAAYTCTDKYRFMLPSQSVQLGEMLGEAIAREVGNIKMPSRFQVMVKELNAHNYGRLNEVLKPFRRNKNTQFVTSPSGAIPVLGEYDVVVLGGGTAGAPAGLSSAQHGAKTLVLDYLHALGGISTIGTIGVYWDGHREGFTKIIDKAVVSMAPADHPRQTHKEGRNVTDWKQEWYRRELLKSGGELWFGVLGCGALIEENKVKGLLVATPWGYGLVRSKVVIDSTGSADIAIAAGASYSTTGKESITVQGAGLGKKDLGDYYYNNDWLFVDDNDMLDVTRAFIQSKNKFTDSYDIVKLPQTRERRRIVGEYSISVYDIINQRRYSDTISYHKSSFDTHGTINDPYFLLSPPMLRHAIYDADVPLRCLLPKGIEGLMVTGLAVSAHRDAMAIIRMQPCLQNQGYAVGCLASMATRQGLPLRKVNIKQLQRHLVELGNLPQRVLTDKDFKGFTKKEFEEAAIKVKNKCDGLSILLTNPDLCKQLLLKQMQKPVSQEASVIYASILCMLGDKTYSSIIANKIKHTKQWDKGWHYTGMGQFGMSVSQLDAYIIALGRSRDKTNLQPILEKARLLKPLDYFSHFRAIAMATESMGSAESASVLYDMLMMPGMLNHSINSYKEARANVVPYKNDVIIRNKALKELHIAQALYLCGDKEHLGQKILRRYSQSLQAHYSRYASETLGE